MNSPLSGDLKFIIIVKYIKKCVGSCYEGEFVFTVTVKQLYTSEKAQEVILDLSADHSVYILKHGIRRDRLYLAPT